MNHYQIVSFYPLDLVASMCINFAYIQLIDSISDSSQKRVFDYPISKSTEIMKSLINEILETYENKTLDIVYPENDSSLFKIKIKRISDQKENNLYSELETDPIPKDQLKLTKIMIDIEIWTFQTYIIDIKIMIHKMSAYPAADDDFKMVSENGDYNSDIWVNEKKIKIKNGDNMNIYRYYNYDNKEKYN